MTPGTGAGQICFWDGGSFWIGGTTSTHEVHAHHAMQVGLALEGRFRFLSPVDGRELQWASPLVGEWASGHVGEEEIGVTNG